MAIIKNLEIKINGEEANFLEKFYIYQNDRGIELNIKVTIPSLEVARRYTSLLRGLNGAMCKATKQKPNKEIDDLNEIGFYKIQFHIYDSEGGRITIPPVEFEVKNLIGIAPDTI